MFFSPKQGLARIKALFWPNDSIESEQYNLFLEVHYGVRE